MSSSPVNIPGRVDCLLVEVFSSVPPSTVFLSLDVSGVRFCAISFIACETEELFVEAILSDHSVWTFDFNQMIICVVPYSSHGYTLEGVQSLFFNLIFYLLKITNKICWENYEKMTITYK